MGDLLHGCPSSEVQKRGDHGLHSLEVSPISTPGPRVSPSSGASCALTPAPCHPFSSQETRFESKSSRRKGCLQPGGDLMLSFDDADSGKGGTASPLGFAPPVKPAPAESGIRRLRTYTTNVESHRGLKPLQPRLTRTYVAMRAAVIMPSASARAAQRQRAMM